MFKQLLTAGLLLCPVAALAEKPIRASDRPSGARLYAFRCASAQEMTRITVIRQFEGQAKAEMYFLGRAFGAIVAAGGKTATFIAMEGTDAYTFSIDKEAMTYTAQAAGGAAFQDAGRCSELG